MKQKLLFILAIISITLCSWTGFNANTWSIRIGKKEVLSSHKNNMGDSAIIDMKKFKPTDTLFIERYLCGYSGDSSLAILIIENQQHEMVTGNSNSNNQFGFTTKIVLSDILSSDKISNGQFLNMYFSIYSKPENIKETVLLARLKFK